MMIDRRRRHYNRTIELAAGCIQTLVLGIGVWNSPWLLFCCTITLVGLWVLFLLNWHSYYKTYIQQNR